MSNKLDESKLLAVVVRHGEEAQAEEIDTGLEAWQALVDGMIEVLPVGRMLEKSDPALESVDLICNEEGKLLGLPPTLDLGFDIIAGDCFFTGPPDDEGNATGLTRAQAESILAILGRG